MPSVSVGVANYTESIDSAQDILKYADLAMYDTKKVIISFMCYIKIRNDLHRTKY